MANLKHWLWLTSRTGMGTRGALRVLEQFGSPEAAFFAGPEEYARIPELSPGARESLASKKLNEADLILGDCDRLGVKIMTIQDAAYPERLRNIYDPPLVLYWKGKDIAVDEEVAVALVGTRKCTPYGEWAAGKLALNLARAGAVVLSGIAEGIDAASIRGALSGGGRVISVLGGGVDVYYPSCNRRLYDDVAAAGALVSEYPPGTETKGRHFPVRNRILSGLSLGVVVVESPAQGGALITAGHALDQDRDVFAVPGPINSPASMGTNRLIGTGAAKLTEKAWDILEEYVDRYPGKLSRVRPLDQQAERQRLSFAEDGRERPTPAAPPKQPREEKKEIDNQGEMEYIDWKDLQGELTEDQLQILMALAEKPLVADDVIERTQIPARRVLSALTLLQVQDYVAEEPGKRFRAKVILKME